MSRSSNHRFYFCIFIQAHTINQHSKNSDKLDFCRHSSTQFMIVVIIMPRRPEWHCHLTLESDIRVSIPY